MATPILEIALSPIAGKTIDDETTPDGEMWQEIFSHVTNIDGLVRASWGLNQYNRDLNLFLVDWESYSQHERFMDEQGTLSKPIMDLMTDDFNMYHVELGNDRTWLKSPITYLTFFVLSKENHYFFAAPLKALKTALSRQAGCTQVISGDARNPARRDVQKWQAGGQQVVVLISGWDSHETLEAAMKAGEVIKATKEAETAAVQTKNVLTTFTVVERTRYEMKWRRLPEPTLKDIPLENKK